MAEDEQGYGHELHMDGDGYDVDDELEVGLQGLGDMEDMVEGTSKQGGGEGEHVSTKELEAMRNKLREMEEEAAKLRELQSKVSAEGGGSHGENPTPGSREEADARSVYVGNVDYSCTPEELQMHFQGCGTVNRVTILADKFGQPKGFAYVEFLEADAVQQAVLLNDTELSGRQIKVNPKRTNVPGMKRGRGRGRGGYGYGAYYPYGMLPFYPPPFPPFGRGYVPRGRGTRGRGRGRTPY